MENRPNWALLAHYVAGTCSPDEERRIDEWIRADPSREQLIEELRSIWEVAEDAPGSSTDPVDVEAAWETVRAEMGSTDSAQSGETEARADRSISPRSDRRSSRNRMRRWGAGVALAVLLMIGGVWLVHSTEWGMEASSDADTRTVETKQGERSQVQLTDGSSVMLNVDSELRLPENFNRKKRIVRLRGEAYFEVEADPDRPFIVRTEDASVTVRGTAFNVRGYPDDERVQVAVAEGGVSFQPENDEGAPQTVRLSAGQVGWAAETDTVVETEMTDVTAYIGWTEGRLVFDDTPLSRVARKLERWYNLDVQIRDPSLHSLRLTANLKSESIENVFDVIAASLNIEYEIDRNTVVLRARERAQ